jgi:hypothetical protein
MVFSFHHALATEVCRQNGPCKDEKVRQHMETSETSWGTPSPFAVLPCIYTHLCECWRVLKFGMKDVRHVILLCLITPFSRLVKIQTGMAVSVRQGTYFGLADLQLLQIQALLQRLVSLTAFSSCFDICLDKINKQGPERMSTYNKSGVQCCSINFPKFNHATIINASIDVSNAFIILYHIHHNHDIITI